MAKTKGSIEELAVEEIDPLEDEDEEEDLEKLLMDELSNAIIQSTDWTTGTLLQLIEKGRIQLDPAFQRRDAWTQERKSKFIESILLGFPIPQLVLAESQSFKGQYIVIDGKQRLLSLIQFAGSAQNAAFNPLQLKGLEILDQLNGKSLEDIRKEKITKTYIDQFEDRTIRTAVIRHWKQETVLYHIFLRLNTESVQLSAQELRNALHPGPFAKFIDAYSAESQSLHRILNRNKPDFRMRDAELLLRFFSFKNYLSDYAGSMKKFLDDTTENFNDKWTEAEDNVKEQAAEFEQGVDLAYKVFGQEDVFRKWKDGAFIGRFNRAVYDVILYYFSDPKLRGKIKNNAAKIKKEFIKLSKKQPEFVTAVETTTKSIQATVTRFSLWTKALSTAIDYKLPTPKLNEGNRIVFGE